MSRLPLMTVLLAGGVFLFLLFYAAAEPARLQKILDEEEAAKRERRARLLPLAGVIYTAHCSECHGFEGEGTEEGPALRSKSFLDAASDAMIEEAIREGRAGTDMRAWAKDHGGPFGPEEVEGLVAFIRSWQPNAPEGDADPRRAR